MREPVTAKILQEFMKALAAAARTPSRVFLVGGATAVLLGWRTSTIDVASPDDFIPEVPGWQERSRLIQQEGKLAFYHYDFYAQTLAKIERGHEIDRKDVEHMLSSGLVEPQRLLELFSLIQDQIYRYPDLDKASFRRAVEQAVERFLKGKPGT